MKIEWSRVTWYSKLLALILLISLPALGFYLGIIYQKSISPSVVLENNTIATTSAKQKSVAKDCGTVTTHGGDLPALDSSANQVEDCFWSSYSSSTEASLTLSYMGVDSGSTTYFSINDKSQVTGYSQSYMVPKGDFEKEDFACAKLTKDSKGLHAINCKFKTSTQDILIPTFP